MEKKWKQFVCRVENDHYTRSQIEKIMENLDRKKQYSALHYAIWHNNLFVIERLIDRKSKFTSGKNKNEISRVESIESIHRCEYSHWKWRTCFTYNCSSEFDMEKRFDRYSSLLLFSLRCRFLLMKIFSRQSMRRKD